MLVPQAGGDHGHACRCARRGKRVNHRRSWPIHDKYPPKRQYRGRKCLAIGCRRACSTRANYPANSSANRLSDSLAPPRLPDSTKNPSRLPREISVLDILVEYSNFGNDVNEIERPPIRDRTGPPVGRWVDIDRFAVRSEECDLRFVFRSCSLASSVARTILPALGRELSISMCRCGLVPACSSAGSVASGSVAISRSISRCTLASCGPTTASCEKTTSRRAVAARAAPGATEAAGSRGV